MTKLTIFCRQASVDTYVTLRLTRGEDVSGHITELDDAHVCLDLGDGESITVFEDILAGWKIHRGNRADAAVEESSGHQPEEDRTDNTTSDAALHLVRSEGQREVRLKSAGTAIEYGDEGNSQVQASVPRTHTSVGDPKVLSVLARVEASFTEAIKRAQLEPPEPDFQFSEVGFPSWRISDIRREWERARSQYGYALKVKEIGRLNSIIVQILAPLAERYPDSSATRSILGRMLLKLDRQSEAKDHLVASATLSDAPEHWFALASAAGKETAVECYALRRYFNLVSPKDAEETWFRYLAVAVDHEDLRRVAQIILYWSEQQKSDLDTGRLLSESVIYLSSSSGAESLALETATNLVHSVEGLPTRWQDEFDRRASPSEELLAVESEFDRLFARISSSAQPARSKMVAQVPHGRIVSFGNQRFGFINAHAGETFFFRIDDTADEVLKHALLNGDWRTFGDVEFEILPSHGHKYNRAVNVVRLQDSDALLQRARNLQKLHQHSQAIALVRRVISVDPTDKTAHLIEAEIKEDLSKKLRSHGIGLPKGMGPYARAKRAQLVDQDLDTAENLFKQAIRQRDKPESAVKDLASLLQQQGRVEDAIILLENNSKRFIGSSYDNMLATLYQHTGRHEDAIEVLTRLSAARPLKKGTLLKQIAFSYLKLARYDEAEQALKEHLASNPADHTAGRWLAGLEDARSAGSDLEAEELIRDLGGLVEEGIQLSSIARAAIEHCTFEGVDPARVQAGTAGSKDIARVEELAKTLGTKRPRDRAAYYLSAAALLKKESDNNEPGRIYDYLRRYFASMANAAWIEKKPAEVVRSYYIESLSLVFGDKLDEAWRSLLRYLTTFSPDSLEDVERIFPRSSFGHDIPRQKYIYSLQKALEIIDPKTEADWLNGLIDIGSQSSFARDCLGEAILTRPSLSDTFCSFLNINSHENKEIQKNWKLRCREYARAYQKRLSECRTLTKYQATVSSMENIDAQLSGASEETAISEVDRRRLNALRNIVGSALTFCSASDDFEEKERNYWLVTMQADRFREEVFDAPTQYSHEGLLPVADHLKSLIEEEYAQMARTSGAELSVRLLVDEYLRGQEGELRLQIEVSNKRGCSPASSVRICLGPGDSEYFTTDQWEREVVSTLRGGNSEVAHMVVFPKYAALNDRVFPIDVVAIYQNSLGEKVHTENHAWTVRLYPDEEFQHLDNPYSPFAEGGPVDDATMFVGRSDLLVRLEKSLLSGSGSKSIVMFGQKRAGKSSLIEHLRRRLAQKEEVLPICFSLQDIAPELSVPALFHRILHGISEALEELRFEGRSVPEFSPPSVDALSSNATLRFHDTMSSIVRALARCSFSLEFVLLIDEFTDIFKEIRKEKIPREFMKAWKAIIEKRYFSSVLVGQDIMPAFKAEFPNEFGVTEDVRVTYLDDTAAATLIQEPIGETRFAGRAVRRILDLTAGSPYYTMMFCARLVDYMNMTRSVILTEADIHAVEEDMLRGDRRLTKDKFDNLLCAGDGMVDSGIDPDHTYAVCRTIVQGSEKEGWCSRELMREFDDIVLDGLLSDLETRDVVERKGTAYRLRVGLFRDWLARQG